MLYFFLESKKIVQKYAQDEISVYAAQASFFIVLSFFPFFMLLLTLVQFFPTVQKSDILMIVVGITPDMLDSFMIGIVEDIYLNASGAILSVSALTALWSASRGMLGIERGLNRIHGITKKRNFIVNRLICAGYTIVFILVCIVSLALLVFSSSLLYFLKEYFPIIYRIVSGLIGFRGLFAVIIYIVSFIGLYTILPQKKQNPWEQIPGALFSTLGWMLFSYGFSIYFTHFSNYANMYGSLTAITLLMLWLYFCIFIIFVGAQLNHFLYHGHPNFNHSE